MKKWNITQDCEPPSNFPVMVITIEKTLSTAIYTGMDDVWLYALYADDLENWTSYTIQKEKPLMWIPMPGLSSGEMLKVLMDEEI